MKSGNSNSNFQLQLLDHNLRQKISRVFRPIRDHYFRAEINGLEKIPSSPVLLVANHDCGFAPVDGLCFDSFWCDHPLFKDRDRYTLVHDLFKIFPKVRTFVNRAGYIPASMRNAEIVVKNGIDLMIYPGGTFESFRPYHQRRKFSLGNRIGFIELALKLNIPIVPVVLVGGHETIYILSRGDKIAKSLALNKLRIDIFPVWAGLPWGLAIGPVPNFPLPSKIQIEVLDPIYPDILMEKAAQLTHDNQPNALHYAALQVIRTKMQTVSDKLYRNRRSLFSKFTHRTL